MKNSVFSSVLEEIEARFSIEQLIKRYSRAIDRQDFALLATIYHNDATDAHGPSGGTAEDFIETVAPRHRNIVHSAHFISNVDIEFFRPDSALVETYGWATLRLAQPDDPSASGRLFEVESGAAQARRIAVYRYVDHVICRDEEWKISSRTLVIGDRWDEHLAAPVEFESSYTVQRHDTNDPYYQIRNDLINKGGI